MTKLHSQNLDQTSVSTWQPDSSFKIATKLQLQILTKLHVAYFALFCICCIICKCCIFCTFCINSKFCRLCIFPNICIKIGLSIIFNMGQFIQVSTRPFIVSQWHGSDKNSMSRVLDLDPFPRNSLWDESSDTLRAARSDMAVRTWKQGSLPVGRVKNTLERTVQDIRVHRSVCV